MKKVFAFCLIFMLTFLVGIGIIGTTKPYSALAIISPEEAVSMTERYLYDFHDEITYLLRYSDNGGYSITHLPSGMVCEFDDTILNPYHCLDEGKFYYGGPGNYYSLSQEQENTSIRDIYNITNEHVNFIDRINKSFETRAYAPDVTESFTLMSSHYFYENFMFNWALDSSFNPILPNGDNYCGRVAAAMLLKYFDTYNANVIPSWMDDSALINEHLSTQLFGLNTTASLCSTIKSGLIDYFDNNASNVDATVTYNILSPRNKIVNRISQDKPSILVLLNSNNEILDPVSINGVIREYMTAHCCIVFGYSTNYYRMNSGWWSSSAFYADRIYNIHRSYVYGAVFLDI